MNLSHRNIANAKGNQEHMKKQSKSNKKKLQKTDKKTKFRHMSTNNQKILSLGREKQHKIFVFFFTSRFLFKKRRKASHLLKSKEI